MKESSTLKIGELAKEAGVTVDTIRFYENKGLLAPLQRSQGGYRIFAQSDKERLLFIQRAKKVGFTLDEIGELLELQLHPGDHTCEEVKHHTQQKIDQVSEKIGELVRIQRSLQRLHTACCGGPESADHCSILQILASTEPL
ncbi:Zn(2+)-responsive transcriptional regulator [Alteromonas pelagimontana]|uniref:Zn(2+)-responsive transcriptional regulator n=1 Tax=Alteromonas pelagimontana TaxID=1858656 RepID=A0A6M4MG73_9ALTE|nr:Zn(2+)-responsive transcriptional regulator [Alteromonas pelagimontana]QJR81206.1 Zn(2+)-responsive transcriptional regulator [Alteromonas pelagimontana]